jgi:hypothetical protein
VAWRLVNAWPARANAIPQGSGFNLDLNSTPDERLVLKPLRPCPISFPMGCVQPVASKRSPLLVSRPDALTACRSGPMFDRLCYGSVTEAWNKQDQTLGAST